MFVGDSPGQVRFVFEAMRETLEGLDPQYPDAHVNVDALRARLAPPN